MKKPTTKLLFVGTVNGESSRYNKKAKTYIHTKDACGAVKGLFKRYMKLYGKADITDLHLVNKENNTFSRVPFNVQECLRKTYITKIKRI